MNGFKLPDRISDEYELLSHIKSSDCAESYIIYDKICQRKALLKVGKTESLENEARLLSKFCGKGVPQVYGCFERDGRSYLLRQYIDGSSLREHIEEKGVLSGSETINIGIDLCETLSRFHDAEPPVIHRDIKPDNVIISTDGEVYIIDFGISREYDISASRDTCIMGTLSSAPPEQFGYGQTDERSDVYSIGILLKETAEGHDPENKVKIDPELASVINKCTEFSPEKRCKNAGEIKKALLKIQKRRSRRLAVSAACVCAAILCTALYFLTGNTTEEPVADNSTSTSYTSEEIQTEDTAEVINDTTYYKFTDSTIEKEVCRILGKEQGTVTEDDLKLMTEIKLIGNTSVDDWDNISIHGGTIGILGDSDITEFGKIHSLDDLAHMPELQTVILCNQDIWDISPLDGLQIKRLALHGNNIADIAPLKNCPMLEQLYISSNPLDDLSPLSELKRLYKINIGATYITALDDIAEIPILRNLEMCDCEYLNDYSVLGGMVNIRHLVLRPAVPEAVAEIRKLTSLESLFIWNMDAEDDLRVFSGLKNLSTLFADWCGLTSLDGIEELPKLTNLYVRYNSIEDFSPVSQNKEIRSIAVTDNPVSDWSFLSDLNMLDHIDCSDEQYDEIISELGDRAENISINIE